MIIVTCVLFFFMHVDICSATLVYHVYFLNYTYTFLQVDNYKLIESKHEVPAKYMYIKCLLSNYQPSWMNALKITYNNLDEFYLVQLNSLLDEISTWWLLSKLYCLLDDF